MLDDIQTTVSGNDRGVGRGDGLGPNEILTDPRKTRSEEHTSELQSLMRISYAVFCLTKKLREHTHTINMLCSEHIAVPSLIQILQTIERVYIVTPVHE